MNMKKFVVIFFFMATSMSVLAAEPTPSYEYRHTVRFMSDNSDRLINSNEKKHVVYRYTGAPVKAVVCSQRGTKSSSVECTHLASSRYLGSSLYEKFRSKIFPQRNVASGFMSAYRRSSTPDIRASKALSRGYCRTQINGYSSLRKPCR